MTSGSRLRGVDDHDVVGGQAAERNGLGGEGVSAPEPAPAGVAGRAVLSEQLEQTVHLRSAEALPVDERQLEEARLQVAGQEQQVVGVDQPLLGVGAQEVLGVADDELVERRARGHEDPDRAGSTSGPAELLPGGGDGPRVADQDGGLQAADVDAELERVGAHHAGDLSAAQAGLDLAPPQRQVARAVAADPLAGVESRRQRLLQVGEHHLDLKPAAAEDDGLYALADPGRRDASRLEHRAAPHAHLAVDQRRVVEDEAPLAARRPASIHELHPLALQQALGQLGRVGDGRRGAEEAGRGAVEVADPLQPPDDVRHLAAEEAAIGVELVDDDELEAGEELAPARVVGQDPGVQHVRVGQDDVPALADGGPLARRRIPVVGVDLDAEWQLLDEGGQLRQLVLCQRLGRKQVQGSPFRVLQKALQDREVVAERLAARRRRHHDQVPAGADGLISLCLVGVESVDPARREGRYQLRPEIRGERREAGRLRRDDVVEGDLARQLGGIELGNVWHWRARA